MIGRFNTPLASFSKIRWSHRTCFLIVVFTVLCNTSFWPTSFHHYWQVSNLGSIAAKQQQGQGQIDDNVDVDDENGTNTPKFTEIALLIKSKRNDLVQMLDKNKALLNTQIEALRQEFYERYGGRQLAMSLLQQSVQTFGDMNATAHRILRAAILQQQQQPLVMSFGGYSVTTGRGNYFSQSYPMVLDSLLQPILNSVFNVNLTVRNGGIGGVPSFPYGFCFAHFLGQDADVVSWDFGLNEITKYGITPAVFEAYLRQAQTQLPRRPMFILIDGRDSVRCDILQNYTKLYGVPADAICVKSPNAILTPEQLEQLGNSSAYSGFERWNDFGAPVGCPGQVSWHPAKKEHEMIGWMMTMHFLTVIESAVDMMLTLDEHEWYERYLYYHDEQQQQYHAETSTASATTRFFKSHIFAPPDNNDAAITTLLFGHDDNNNNNTASNTRARVSCRTNFLPATDDANMIPSIVVSGWNDNITADTVLLQKRTLADYQVGWVLDITDLEREVSLRAEMCGMGYLDKKIAMYGAAPSGILRLWLPLLNYDDDTSSVQEEKKEVLQSNLNALSWLGVIVICDINEWRPATACRLDADVEYSIGGAPVINVTMIAGGPGQYLGRRICASLTIPEQAQVVALKDVQTVQGELISDKVKQRLGGEEVRYGVIVDVTPKAHVTVEGGACSVAHVVWQ